MLPMTQVTVDPILASAWTARAAEKEAKITPFGGRTTLGWYPFPRKNIR